MSPADIWQRILAAPADAGLKAEYVAALTAAGDSRAELFALAADYERLRSGSYIDAAAELKPRLDSRLAEWRAYFAPHTDAWSATITFVMGWPIELAITAADFARCAADIVATLPIRHLDLAGISERPAVFDVPQFDQIASLNGSKQVWSAAALGALANSAHLGSLRWLDLSACSISEAQVEVLAASAALKNVAMLDLTDNPAPDPVDASAGYGVDWQSNRIIPDSIFLPAFGVELEAKYGKIAWLHGLWNYLEDYPPSRYSF
jgi:hypothetical protein